MQFLDLDAQLPELTARTASVPDAASARMNEVVVFMYSVPLLNQ
jgi:hypothetical protein